MDLYKQLQETNELLAQKRAQMQELEQEQLFAFNQIPEGMEATASVEFMDAYKNQTANDAYIQVLEQQKQRLEDEIQASILERTRDWNLQTGEYRLAEIQHVRETRNKGVFGRLGMWFKRHFSRSADAQPTLPAVERDTTIKSSRYLLEEERIRRLRLEDSISKSEAMDNFNEEKNVMAEKYDGKRPEFVRKNTEVVEADFQKIESLLVENGWHLKNGPVPGEMTEGSQKEIKTRQVMSSFFRELGNASVDVNYKSLKKEGKFKYAQTVKPLKEVVDLLSNKDEVHIAHFLKDILSFSLEDTYKQYPIHTMSAETRLEKYPILEEMAFRLNAQCQLAQKFMKHEVSEELRKRIDNAAVEISVFQNVVKSIGQKEFAYKDYYSKAIKNIDEMKNYQDHADDYANILSVMRQGGNNGVISETQVLVDSLKKENVKTFAKDIVEYSLITKTGRPRLIGNEPADVILKFAAEDVSYYTGLQSKANLVLTYLKTNPDELPEGITDEMIKKCQAEANTLMFALNDRLKNAGAASKSSVEEKAGKTEDKYWYLEKMNQDAERLGVGKVGFEGQEPEITKEMMAQRERALQIVGPKNVTVFDAYKKFQAMLKSGNRNIGVVGNAVVNACQLYNALVFGPVELYESLSQDIGTGFKLEDLKLIIDICEHEISHGNVATDNLDYLTENSLDIRLMSTLSPGYKVDAEGKPITEEDKANKEAATTFIQRYQVDKEYRFNYVKDFIENCLSTEISWDMVQPEYIEAHFIELREIADKNMLISNLMSDVRNKEYFDKMTKEEKEKLNFIGVALGTTLGHLMRYYSYGHSFSAGNGAEILSKDRQETFLENTPEDQVITTCDMMREVLEERKKGFKLPDLG